MQDKTNTPAYPALVELASRLEGKDKKTCELALYCLNRQDKQLAKKDAEIKKISDQKDYFEGALLRETKRSLKVIELWGNIEKLQEPLLVRITELENTLKDIWGGCVHEDLSHQQIAYKAIAALADGHDK